MLAHYEVTMHVYAESEQEAKELESELKEFVRQKYNQGIYVRAARLTNLLRRFGNNPIVNNALR